MEVPTPLVTSVRLFCVGALRLSHRSRRFWARLARAVGHQRALELTVLCERITGQQAFEYGLVSHLSEDGKELELAKELARKVVSKPALPVALTKASMKALRRQTESGDATYSDQDLLLYSRLMQQRRRRRGGE